MTPANRSHCRHYPRHWPTRHHCKHHHRPLHYPQHHCCHHLCQRPRCSIHPRDSDHRSILPILPANLSHPSRPRPSCCSQAAIATASACTGALVVASVRSPIGSMRRRDLTSRSFQIHRRQFAGVANSCDGRLCESLPCDNYSQNAASSGEFVGDPCAGRHQMSSKRVANGRSSPLPSLMVHWLSLVAITSFTSRVSITASRLHLACPCCDSHSSLLKPPVAASQAHLLSKSFRSSCYYCCEFVELIAAIAVTMGNDDRASSRRSCQTAVIGPF